MQNLKDNPDLKGEGKRIVDISNGNGHYYTGNKSKQLLVHVMQDGIEVDKPIKTKIYNQSVEWNKRHYPIIPSRFYYDFQGIAHQQVASNDVSVLTFKKDHTDVCKKCSGKMTIDAREARELGKRGVFHAIWGIDSTHMILLILFAIGAMGMAGAFMYFYNQDSIHKTQLDSVSKQLADTKAQLCIMQGNCPAPEPPAGTVVKR